MKRVTRANSVGLAFLLSTAIACYGAVAVLPTSGNSVGVASSTTEGRWLVFRAAPFGMVQSTTVVAEGTTRCIWEGTAGEYTAVLIPADQTKPLEFGTVTLGGGSPNPDPDPQPPGARQVVVLAEQTRNTAAREVAIKTLRDYVRDNENHTWRLYDPDDVDESGQTPDWLQPMLTEAKKVGLPAMLIYDTDSKLVHAVKLPDAGSTASSGQAAGESAIKTLKEHGG